MPKFKVGDILALKKQYWFANKPEFIQIVSICNGSYFYISLNTDMYRSTYSHQIAEVEAACYPATPAERILFVK